MAKDKSTPDIPQTSQECSGRSFTLQKMFYSPTWPPKKKKNKGMMDIGWSCSYSHSTLQWR